MPTITTKQLELDIPVKLYCHEWQDISKYMPGKINHGTDIEMCYQYTIVSIILKIRNAIAYKPEKSYKTISLTPAESYALLNFSNNFLFFEPLQMVLFQKLRDQIFHKKQNRF